MASASILIVEHTQELRDSIARRLTEDGYDVATASSGVEAFEAIRVRDFDLVLLERELPDVNAIEVLKEIVRNKPDLLVIAMTKDGSVESAVRTIKAGAYDYLTKPIDLTKLSFIIQKALETTKLRHEVADLKAQLGSQAGEPKIIGRSPQMAQVFAMIDKVARSGATTVLLQRETGTGKGVVARAIHARSRRAQNPFLVVTCTAIPQTLLESELFGHERGAFTDARARKRGQFELADGGTILLDEVGDLPLDLQAKLLRFIDEKKFVSVGGTSEISVDVRIIAATNQMLDKAVEEGRFRPDLYYRLKIVPITLPPLRERREDIPLLAEAFIQDFNKEFGKHIKGIEEDAQMAMMEYEWPGNVRELRNMLERAVLLSRGDYLGYSDLFPEREPESMLSWVDVVRLPPEGTNLRQVEVSLVKQALAMARGKQTLAAKLLGLTRDQLRSRIKKYGLNPAEFKR